MSDPAIFGVGVTRSRDNPAEPAFLVLVDMGRTPRSTPSIIGGLRVVYMHHALEVDDRPACISVRGAGNEARRALKETKPALGVGEIPKPPDISPPGFSLRATR